MYPGSLPQPKHCRAGKNNKTWKEKSQILPGWMPKYCVAGAKRAARFGSQILQPLLWLQDVFWSSVHSVVAGSSKGQWILTEADLLLGHACCICSRGESLDESFDSRWALGLERVDSHGSQDAVTHHPFTVGSGMRSGGWLGCEWVTDQAHSRTERFRNDIFKSAGQMSTGTRMSQAIGISGLPSEDTSISNNNNKKNHTHANKGSWKTIPGRVLWKLLERSRSRSQPEMKNRI